MKLISYTCSMKNIFTLFLVLFPFAAGAQTSLRAADFDKSYKSAKDPVLVDVRTPGEFARGFIEKATLIDISKADAQQRLLRLPKDQPIYVYCLSGSRSWDAASYLKKKGYTQVYDLSGGIMSWSRAGLPISRSSAAVAKPDWTSERLKSTISSTKGPVLVNFYAPWCAPCKQMEPSFSALSKEFAGKVVFHHIDLDKNASLADAERIASIPVTRMYVNGKLVTEKSGFIPEAELRKLFETAAKSKAS